MGTPIEGSMVVEILEASRCNTRHTGTVAGPTCPPRPGLAGEEFQDNFLWRKESIDDSLSVRHNRSAR